MCGIAGIVPRNWEEFSERNIKFESLLNSIGDTMINRGPDARGIYVDPLERFGMVHQRLSILELSSEGSQPMQDSSKNFVIVFNGEIYNHLELRQLEDLKFVEWRGRSDTETLIELIKEFGLIRTLELIEGMFAFALYDKRADNITLVRDRFGEKPLFFSLQDNVFSFSSQITAFCKIPDFNIGISTQALSYYLEHGYVRSPLSILEGVFKLAPGTCLEFNLKSFNYICFRYWSHFSTARKRNESKPLDISKLESLINKSVKGQMISDVPLGAFLSGGIDSSLIVALMSNNSSKPIKTFTIGFEEGNYNEATYAKKIAEHLNTDHTELYVSSEDAIGVINELALIYDEPFADSSQIPTYLVSRLAKSKVTVVLSGDAGDELFGGYNRYVLTKSMWSKLSKIPMFIRKFISSLILTTPPLFIKFFSKFFPRKYNVGNLFDRLNKISSVLVANSIEDVYRCLTAYNTDVKSLIKPEHYYRNDSSGFSENIKNFALDPIEKMMLSDTDVYLPDDILVKVDRASMAVSLESRVPFLNRDLYEYLWTVRLDDKIVKGKGKKPLRDILSKYVPVELFDRPKTGFGIPISDWLRSTLSDWVDEIIADPSNPGFLYLNFDECQRIWAQHKSGERDWHYKLWTILMFLNWCNHNIKHFNIK